MAKKKEKIEDLKSLSVPELRKQATAMAEEMFGLRLQNIAGQLENSAKIKQVRRQIARVKTMMSQKAQGQ